MVLRAFWHSTVDIFLLLSLFLYACPREETLFTGIVHYCDYCYLHVFLLEGCADVRVNNSLHFGSKTGPMLHFEITNKSSIPP